MDTLKRIYGASFVFSLSLALAAYINSTFLSEHVGTAYVGIIFSGAALLTIIGLEILPHVVAKIGNRNTTLTLFALNLASVGIISGIHTPLFTGIAFVLFNASNTLIWYCLDIFVEHFSKETNAGSIRGLYLSITNLAWIGAPLVAGIILSQYGYSGLYSIVFGLVFCVVIWLRISLMHYKDASYRVFSTAGAIKQLLIKKDLGRITLLNFLLQFFYAWMVVFTPIYLHEVLGIGFQTIGIMFLVMLLPFILLQYPLGKLTDSKGGERKILFIGIGIISIATIVFGWYTGNNIVLLTSILFLTRVGASIIEVMTETYFFKHVTDADAEIIGLFRTTTPLAYLIAPLAGSLILLLGSYQILFILLGCITFVGIVPLYRLNENI